MKLLKLFTLSILTLSLTSCGLNFFIDDDSSSSDTSINEDNTNDNDNTPSSKDENEIFNKKSVKLYDVTSLTNSNQYSPIDQYYEKNVSLYFYEDDTYVPYITLTSYMSLLDKYTKQKGNTYRVTYEDDVLTFNIRNGSIDKFTSEFDLNNKTVEFSKSFSNVFNSSGNYSNSSIYAGCYFNEVNIINASNEVYSYKDTSYQVVKDAGEYYFPLSFIEALFGAGISYHFFYNYNHLFLYSDYSYFSTMQMIDGANPMRTPIDEMRAIVEDVDTIPTNVLNDNYNSLSFIFNNRYGLRGYYYTDFDDYLIDLGIKDKFLSGDRDDLKEAQTTLISALDDGHTGSVGAYSAWFNSYNESEEYGPKITNMVNVRNSLTNLRTSTLGSNNKEIHYSSSGTLAFITLNSFNNYLDNAYTPTHSLRDDLYQYDDYFYLVHQLEEIESHNASSSIDVTDVVIDVSTNGGGVVQTMMKAASLLTTSNNLETYWWNDISNELTRYYAHISHKTYGDTFNFYILTSEYSYSAANYFAYILDEHNAATIIGKTSGGGECIVDVGPSLPIGTGFMMSTNLHLGKYDGASFTGDELGAVVDSKWIIEHSNFFNLNYIANLINSNS